MNEPSPTSGDGSKVLWDGGSGGVATLARPASVCLIQEDGIVGAVSPWRRRQPRCFRYRYLHDHPRHSPFAQSQSTLLRGGQGRGRSPRQCMAFPCLRSSSSSMDGIPHDLQDDSRLIIRQECVEGNGDGDALSLHTSNIPQPLQICDRLDNPR